MGRRKYSGLQPIRHYTCSIGCQLVGRSCFTWNFVQAAEQFSLNLLFEIVPLRYLPLLVEGILVVLAYIKHVVAYVQDIRQTNGDYEHQTDDAPVRETSMIPFSGESTIVSRDTIIAIESSVAPLRRLVLPNENPMACRLSRSYLSAARPI